MKSQWHSTCIAILSLAAFTTSASAETPERIAHLCISHVEGIVERCTNAAADETHECVRTIRALLEAGRVEAAHQVARECIRSATARTEACVDHVIHVCRECVNALLDLGAVQLARRVANACEAAILDLRHLLQREKNAIEQALGG
jgi:hypothetical protein